MKDIIYDHYIAIDWSIINMAIARMTKKSNKITVIDVPSDIVELKVYLNILSKRQGGQVCILHSPLNSVKNEDLMGSQNQYFTCQVILCLGGYTEII